MGIVVPGLEVVAPARVVARGIVVRAHPPNGGVGEELEMIRASALGFEEHSSLVGVCSPIP